MRGEREGPRCVLLWVEERGDRDTPVSTSMLRSQNLPIPTVLAFVMTYHTTEMSGHQRHERPRTQWQDGRQDRISLCRSLMTRRAITEKQIFTKEGGLVIIFTFFITQG